MDTQSENIYNLLMRLCPDMIRPFAEMMLPNALMQMEQQQKDDLEAQLMANKDSSDVDNAHMLIAFAKAMGADESMFEVAKGMGFEIDEEVKALI
jgi:hypothetical protein